MKRKNLYVMCTTFIVAFVAYTFASFSNPTDKAHEPSVLTNALLLIDNSFHTISYDTFTQNESLLSDSNSSSDELASNEEAALITVSSLTQEDNVAVKEITEEEENTSTDHTTVAPTEELTNEKAVNKEDVASSKKEVDHKASKVKAKISVANDVCKDENIAISVASSYVNIREKADTESKILGKLYSDNAAHILKTEGDWLYISSGNVEGYVKSEYVVSGLSEKELKKYGTVVAKVIADGLNVRKEATTDSKRVDVIYQGESYPVLKQKDDWVKLSIEDDDVKGYVLADHVEIQMTFSEAISIAEENALKKIEQEKAEEKQQTTASNSSSKVETVYGSGTSYSKDELRLLACLIHSEAGNQSYEGKLAVANVVLNRVKSSKYPDSIYDVIYQNSQFSVASNGSLKKQLNSYSNYNSSSQKLSIQAAKDALNGVNNIGKRLYFNRYSSHVANAHSSNGVKIDGQFFW